MAQKRWERVGNEPDITENPENGASQGAAKGANMTGADLKPLEQAGKSEDSAAPGLHVLATPIGNARDISLRALGVLKTCALICAEDTRVTAKLLAIHGISRPLWPYNDHNAARIRPRILAALGEGKAIVLVSDAGTPLVSDPGFKLVGAVLAAGLAVHVVPGASAVLAALTLSGLPSDRFLFAGFLPHKAGERETALTKLAGVPATLIFFESAQRLAEALAAMAVILGPRACAVTRELTKRHEQVRRGTLPELAEQYAGEDAPRGEITIVVGPPLETGPDFSRIEAALARALPFMPVKAASELIAELTGAPRKEVYARAIKMKDGNGGA